MTAGTLFIHAACLTFSASSMTSATSDRCTGAPLRYATMSGRYSRAGQKLIVGGDGERTLRSVEGSLGLIHVGRGDGAAQIFQAQPIGSQRSRIGLNPHGRTLPAADTDQPHARQLRDLLRQTGVREILDAGSGRVLEVNASVSTGASAGLTLL